MTLAQRKALTLPIVGNFPHRRWRPSPTGQYLILSVHREAKVLWLGTSKFKPRTKTPQHGLLRGEREGDRLRKFVHNQIDLNGGQRCNLKDREVLNRLCVIFPEDR